jgi:hypothetical protein
VPTRRAAPPPAGTTHSLNSSLSTKAIERPLGDQTGYHSASAALGTPVTVKGVPVPDVASTTTSPLLPLHTRRVESGDHEVPWKHCSGREPVPFAFITAAPSGASNAISLPSGEGTGSDPTPFFVNFVRPVPSGFTA